MAGKGACFYPGEQCDPGRVVPSVRFDTHDARHERVCAYEQIPRPPKSQSRGVPETHNSEAVKWRNATPKQRSAVAARAAAILRERADEFAHSLATELGRVMEEARREVALGAEIIEFYAQAVQPKASPEGRPLLFCVQPGNCSYDQLARLSAPNLLAGNIVMVKHAGKVPQSALAFEQLWLEAGAPKGAYANLLISYD